jgi:hypothetical protein
LFGWNVRLLTRAPQVQFVICYGFNGVSLLTVWGIPAQVKLAPANRGTGG